MAAPAADARAQSVALVVHGLLLDALFAVLPFMMAGILSFRGFMVLMLGICLIIVSGCIGMAVRYGPNGRRAAERLVCKKVVFEGMDDDALWKWGGLYWNPDDPAVWASKRRGIDWTINAAHPRVWAKFLGLMAVLLAGAFAVAFLA